MYMHIIYYFSMLDKGGSCQFTYMHSQVNTTSVTYDASSMHACHAHSVCK